MAYAAVENADTFGDARKADFNRIKADVSTDHIWAATPMGVWRICGASLSLTLFGIRATS